MSFSILTWNILADCCADNSPQGFPHADPEILKWEYRSNLIVERVFKERHSIICLQEVEHPQPLIDAAEKLGYGHDFTRSNGAKHGLLVMWLLKDFQLITSRSSKFTSSTQSYSMFVFNKNLVVVTTHLKAKPEFSHVRSQQIKEILEIVGKCQGPVIIAGDFNAIPTEDCITQVSNNFTNAFPECKFTTVKLRKELVCRVIDYIWFKCLSLESAGLLPSQPPEHPYYPNSQHPSDHIHLTATFRI